jgi:hypothetical protein
MRTIAATALQKLMASESGISLPILIQIDHDLWETPLYLVNNKDDVVYDGNTYKAFPFRFDPADINTDGSVQNGKLTIAAVDQTMTAAIRALSTPPTITTIAALISYSPTGFASDTLYPSDMLYPGAGLSYTIEPLATWTFTLRNVTGNVEYITGELELENALENEVPAMEFRPRDFPGLF